MKETNFHSKYLIEILKERYKARETILSDFNKVIVNEILAFKLILFISQMEVFFSNEDLNFRKKVISGSCLFALEEISTNPKVDLFETFLKNIMEVQLNI